MQPDETPEDAGFRTAVRQWLAANAPAFEIGEGVKLDDRAEMEGARAWQRRLWEGGYAGIALDKILGGAGLTPMHAAIFAEEESAYRLPRGYIGIGQRMALPVIARHGRPDQIERFGPLTLRGDIVWCQLFSEPGAGSDLAAVRTQAQRDGDDWIVSGQKTWSSWSQHADWAILLARTDASVAKHKGLSFFLLDMRQSGIDIRPIRQISGLSDFSDVFLDEVRISDDWRVGAPGEGWACAMTVLANERLNPSDEGKDTNVGDLVAIARTSIAGGRPALEDEPTRLALAEAYAKERAEKLLHVRLRAQVARGEDPGIDSSIIKLSYGQRMQRLTALAMELQGLGGLAPGANQAAGRQAMNDYLWSTALRIAGGADEVLRNQIAERILGMPGEHRPDRNVPFEKLGQLAGIQS